MFMQTSGSKRSSRLSGMVSSTPCSTVSDDYLPGILVISMWTHIILAYNSPANAYAQPVPRTSIAVYVGKDTL